MDEKLCSIDDFDKVKSEEKVFVSKKLYRIKIEKRPSEEYRYWIEEANKYYKDAFDTEYLYGEDAIKYEDTFSYHFKTIKDAKEKIDYLIEKEKINSGFYITEYIKYPEDNTINKE